MNAKNKNSALIKIVHLLRIRMILSFALLAEGNSVSATTFYSRTSGGNWNANATWSTASYGGASASAFPIAGDDVKIGNGYTIYINTSSACATIDIGQGTSGQLEYSSGGNYTLTVSGNITIYSGGTLIYNSNASRTHTLTIGGNLTNNGTVSLVYDNNDIVNATFNTSSNSTISGSGTWSLKNVTMNKSTVAATMDVQSSAFETAIVTLTTTEGTYIHDNSGSYSVNSSGASTFYITENVAFKVPQGSVTFSPGSNYVYLNGSLYINGGTVYIATTAGINGLRYQQIGGIVPYLEVSSGSLVVYGGISYATGSSSDPFSFKMTGGTILLNSGTTGTIVEPFLVNDVSSSSFYMSAGTITMQSPNITGSSVIDWGICGNNGSVTTLAGTVQFGNASTGNNKTFNFAPYANAVQPNMVVAGPSGNTITLAPNSGTSADYKFLSLKINSGKIFDNRSYGGTNYDSKGMTLTSTYDGVYGFYNDGTLTPRTGIMTMGSTEAQSIGGSATTTFYNLTISCSGNVTLETAENVSNLLTMTSGNLVTTATKIITVTSTGNATMGSTSSYVDGPMINTVATSSTTTRNYPIGKGSAYRPAVLSVTHSNSTSVTYKGEVFNSSATALNYILPSTISRVSSVRYWNFTRQNVSNFSTANMTLYYDVDDSVVNKNRVSMVHDNGIANWIDYGGTGTANVTGNITSNTITNFNTIFALGFPPATLPIQLISFTAKREENSVRCEWTTASETNSNYFTVERSVDGIAFDSLTAVKGSGNSHHNTSYHITDANPLQGNSFYRLSQTDFDGRKIYFEPVHIFYDEHPSYTMFPNPTAGNLIYVSKEGNSMEDVQAVVQDMTGKEVLTTMRLSKDKKELQISIDPSASCRNNFFVVNVLSMNESSRQKVLVEKK